MQRGYLKLMSNDHPQPKAKKKFGQNFLHSDSVIKKIVDIISPEGKQIIEIGPGTGALTKHLVNKCTKLVAFEIDPDMIKFLNQQNYFNSENNMLVHDDFLNANLDQYAYFEVVGNIPYYITSEIIFKLIENRFLFKRATLLVQKEVADRIVAMPNSYEYSKLSITCQYVAKVKKELFVSKNNFSPVPKVDSAIVTFDFYQDKNDNYEQLKDFFKLCFSARRKKLIWSLKQVYSQEKILNAYSVLNISENIRIQQLDLETIKQLYAELETK
ncbi:Dimethyladenosine transferase(S adenosylmethionine 6 N', N' adenosyl(rRNA) dimethyltransferase) (16S rRNA dimethylase) (High levelkasugamycin resistance protein ksgA) (Kasugamycindimethyltransferase) [Mycoplasmopsis agalactiae]|uniref:Ribosomal RNA small subunit methyltransferase A n=3 Tax=Bacteria TaxID=2 RepID=D3VQ38_MYCAA|nr:16S rRNA (adenine(1518)-N(6)/adenine(1519)-N(6))-dimethyltransferase RsmA [Mycoplasmopsis agalactiae]CBH40287.1 Dimethyladenosine transferase(S adenosylmethionine 6 N', N' adenosyl(rRNA) dimethyltransferase) (16S rRNA dimethylase) (High levelkasugamycin resistance protein ksgA) (Kasugamycindimethyltransferase) [Mycoplasmopsis agalactiae]